MTFIAFYRTNPTSDLIKELNKKKAHLFNSTQDAFYVHCPEGIGKVKLPNFEKELGVSLEI